MKTYNHKTIECRKILDIADVKATKAENGALVITGYANTKGHPDRYGDIPTVLLDVRDYVYELKDYLKNPVLLIDHVNTTDHVAGSIVDIKEDDKGLYFKALFSASQHPTVAHARQVYEEGHAKGISIAGRFHFEDENNPNLLTYAEIFEISLVPIPADPQSLAAPAKAMPQDDATTKQIDAINGLFLEQDIKAINNKFAKSKALLQQGQNK